MKKLFIALIMLIGTYSTNAQQGIRIINNSNCEVWFTLRGNTTSTCTSNPYKSNAISISCCSTTITYADPTVVPGGMQNSSSAFLTSADYINQITIHNADPNGICYVDSKRLNDCITSDTHYTSDPNNDCNDDCSLTITWTPSGGGVTYATVTIN